MTPWLFQKQRIKMWWTEQNEVPNMLPPPQIVIQIFLRMSALGQDPFWFVLVINEHSILATYQTGPHHFQAQKYAQKPVFFPLSLLQKLRSSFQRYCGISPTSKQNVTQPTVLATLLFSKIHHNHNCNCTHLHTTAHHLASTCTTALLPTVNNSTHSISLLLAAVVSLHGQSANHLITPCIYQNSFLTHKLKNMGSPCNCEQS